MELVINNNTIQVRHDGFMNLTQLCKAASKKVSHYLENRDTKEFIEVLSNHTGKPALGLIIVNRGGSHEGTFAHIQIAMHCAYWCSPKFAMEVNSYYLRFKSGDLTLIPEVINNHDKIHQLETTIVALSDELTNSYKLLSNNMSKLQLVEKDNETLRKRDIEVTELSNRITTHPLINPSAITEANRLSMQSNTNSILSQYTDLKPLVQIATEMGYHVSRSVQISLGQWVNRWYSLEHPVTRREKRIGGVLHMSLPIWWYEHTAELEEVIHQFYQALENGL